MSDLSSPTAKMDSNKELLVQTLAKTDIFLYLCAVFVAHIYLFLWLISAVCDSYLPFVTYICYVARINTEESLTHLCS